MPTAAWAQLTATKAYTRGTSSRSIAVISSWEKSTVAPWRTAAPVTPPAAAVSTATTGSSTEENPCILSRVSLPSPIITAISVMVRAVMASTPARLTA